MKRLKLKVQDIKAREILDSRGNPTIEVEIKTGGGVFKSSVPSGASRGKYEAVELRDGGNRFLGKGVLKAVENVVEVIAPKFIGKKIISQREADDLMIELDGTENKSRLGANAILAVSMALAKAGAAVLDVPLYRYISRIYRENLSAEFDEKEYSSHFPQPCFNILNGGMHAGNGLNMQEFMILPQIGSFSENLRAASEIYHTLRKILLKRFGKFSINVGDEGGFAPNLHQTRQALDIIREAIEAAGYKNKVGMGLDCAASQFFDKESYCLDGKHFNRPMLLRFYEELAKDYPIVFFEDPFSQDDWEGFVKITGKFNQGVLVIGDDLLATNTKRMRLAHNRSACSGMIIKPNQVGTLSEAIDAAKLARKFSWKIIASHRSGETCDSFIADFAVGVGSDFIKSGAPARGERVAKYNRLLEIEREQKN